MRRRAPEPPAVPHAYASNRCRALVRVDGSAIRNKIRREYEKALRDLEKARQALDQFQQRDQPQFSRWMSSHFGALLTELVFSLDGLGLLGFESAIRRDYPVLFATLYIFTLLGLVMQIVGDFTYTLVDPRIDFEAREV